MIDYLSKPEDYKFWLYTFYNHYEPKVIYNGGNTREFLNRHCNFSEYYEKRKHKIKKILTKYFKKFFIESKIYRPFTESDFELIEKMICLRLKTIIFAKVLSYFQILKIIVTLRSIFQQRNY